MVSSQMKKPDLDNLVQKSFMEYILLREAIRLAGYEYGEREEVIEFPDGFIEWLDEHYGIRVTFSRDMYVDEEYEITDPKLHLLFMLKFSK